MHISRIELNNFRNHQHLVIDDIGKVLVIVGDNAVGKTNIVEALQFLSSHESFRRPKGEELIFDKRKEGETTSLSLTIHINEVINEKKISFDEGTKVISYNKKVRSSKELTDQIPSVLFTPDDLQIIKGPPEQRRDLLDNLGSRLSKTFGQIRSEYGKALRHKNSLLKQEEFDEALLDSWNINLSKLGASLSKHRQGLLNRLLTHAKEVYAQISGGEQLEGRYLVSWNQPEAKSAEEEAFQEGFEKEIIRSAEEEEKKEQDDQAQDQSTESLLYRALKDKSETERAAKRSLLGPHKDDILFTIDSKDARRFASQGQQRSIALALKIAEIEILKQVSGKNPLLLLDDVMSELDTARRSFFVEQIETRGQTVLTTTNLGYFEPSFLEQATVFELKRKQAQR